MFSLPNRRCFFFFFSRFAGEREARVEGRATRLGREQPVARDSRSALARKLKKSAPVLQARKCLVV